MPNDHDAYHLTPSRRGFGHAMGGFWLRQFFRLARRAPQAMAAAKGPICAAAFKCSKSIRKGTRANARHVLGAGCSDAQRDALAREMLESFYLFCCDVGRSQNATREELAARVECIEGHENYVRAREPGRGAIIVTAHMGSFEVGMAALRQIEPKIHVIFKRDAVAEFERGRSALRQRLGVMEAALDDGWSVWMRVRDGLLANDAVVMQGDRVMPGQKGERVAFLDGHIELPWGPIKLAKTTGSPIVPVFSERMENGKVRLFVEEAIWVEQEGNTFGEQAPAAMAKLASVLEKHVRSRPHQWLALHGALCEDQAALVTPRIDP